jgi:threonine/homoserine/homoserine lactone efflux protein
LFLTIFEIVVFAFTAFVVGFSGAIVPGPMLTVLITESLKKDYKAGTSVVIGHVIAEAGIVALIGLGLNQIIGLRETFIFICVLGGGLLALMGFSLVKSLKGHASIEVVPDEKVTYGPIYGGLVMSVQIPSSSCGGSP